jgi:alpha-ketoglutarate-dependent taurine dioxygenase
MNDMATGKLPVNLGSVPGAANGLPLAVTPGRISDLNGLVDWLQSNADWLHTTLRSHGALLFRGFGVTKPEDFERLARCVDSELKNEYLGTSPRDALTDYVFSASELPGYYPIPEHCEMTFTANPPRRIFFWCGIEPQAPGGETPLVDFAAVWRDLDPAVRRRFDEKGIRIVRNYSGPGANKRDLFQLKRWDEMFRTTDKQQVEAMARREGFEPRWSENDRLTLISRHLAARPHPETGEPVWFNHSQVFHLSAAPGEFSRIFRLRPGLRSLGLWLFSSLLVAWKRLRYSSDDQAMHCTFADGSEISDADMEAVREAIWKNLAVVAWKQGDVVAIDNNRVGHGRLPYRGPRMVAVCWA